MGFKCSMCPFCRSNIHYLACNSLCPPVKSLPIIEGLTLVMQYASALEYAACQILCEVDLCWPLLMASVACNQRVLQFMQTSIRMYRIQCMVLVKDRNSETFRESEAIYCVDHEWTNFWGSSFDGFCKIILSAFWKTSSSSASKWLQRPSLRLRFVAWGRSALLET